MARKRTTYACTACGQTHPKWLGRCTACGEWGTVEEEAAPPAPPPGGGRAGLPTSKPRRLKEVEGGPPHRASTGIGELDRVLGGGLVPGALVLIGGDPGIGKSTLLLQASDRIARFDVPVLYVSGEESARQTRLRFDRIGAEAESLWLVAETSLSRIEHHVTRLEPRVLVIDSVQTLYTDDVGSAPGSVAQLRAITSRLMALAKGREIVTFVVGHVTKAGNLAGPRMLEHMVDTVLYLEGQRGHPFRLLRAVKNRFGNTDELGAFEMKSDGLAEVDNPSALFLAERAAGASGSVVAACFEGTRPLLVEVQALVTHEAHGTPRRTAIGFDGNRTALLLAVLERKAGLDVGGDVFVNVAGGMRLDEPAADLPVIAALASSHRDRPLDPKVAVFGEVGLGGEIRGVIGADARIVEARRLGFERIVLPAGNRDAARQLGEQGLVPVSTVEQALDVLF